MTPYVGTRALVRLALRRDRVMLPVWIAVFVGVATSSASATVGLYPTVASRVAAAKAVNETPSLVALYGKVYDPTSLGAVSLIKMIAFGSALVGVLGIVTLVRHTRAEEQTGRLELLGATVLGRRAALTAALLVVTAANLALGLCAALGLAASGLPVEGSLVFGAAWAGNGIAFAAVAALAAQLTTSARAATGVACAALGASYLLRAVGDTASHDGAWWLSWLSPVGWAQQLRPFAGNRWGVVGLTAAFAVAVSALAFRLAGRRDLGAGLLPDRPGSPRAVGWLRSPLALAWRLQRGLLLGWAVSFAVLGAVLGNIASSVSSIVDSAQAEDFIRRLGGQQGLTDAFLAAELAFGAVIASAYGVQAVLRLRAEEVALHAEPVLGTAVGRVRWAASHLLVALGGTAGLLLTVGLAAGVSSGLVHGSGGVGHQVWRLTGAALAQLPSVWVLVGIALAVFALLPEQVVGAWVALVAFLLLGVLGPVFRFPQAVMDLSPYAHTPRLPGGAMHVLPLAVLGTLAVALVATGLAGFRRRDLG